MNDAAFEHLDGDDPDNIPARLADLCRRVIADPSIRGVIVLICPAEEAGRSDVEVYGFGPAVEEGAVVDRMLDMAKRAIRHGGDS